MLQRAKNFRDKFERSIAQDRYNQDLRHKAYTAIAAKMARIIHAVITSGEPYPLFLCKGEPERKDLSLASREGSMLTS